VTRANKIYMQSNVRERIFLIGLLLALLVIAILSVTLGRYSIAPGVLYDCLYSFFTGQPLDEDAQQAQLVLLVVRIPRILLCMMVGAALAASGAAYQSLFRNPMVSPDILGVTSASAVGAALGILLSLPVLVTHALSFTFGIIAVIVVVSIAKAITGGGRLNLVILILAGVVISSLFTAIISLIKFVADGDQKLPEIVFWLMGSFARSGGYYNVGVMFFSLLGGLIPLFLIRWRINALAFGEEEAQAMGINTRQTTFIIAACATLLTATAVSLCGCIGWVGLLVPHICRFFVGPNFRILLPVSIVGGALFMLLVDNVCRTLISGELPVGVITSLLGAPVFLSMLFYRRKEWS